MGEAKFSALSLSKGQALVKRDKLKKGGAKQLALGWFVTVLGCRSFCSGTDVCHNPTSFFCGKSNRLGPSAHPD